MSSGIDVDDNTINEWIDMNESLSSKEWMKKKINGLSEIDNPFFDPVTTLFEDFSHHPSISIMSSTCLAFEFENESIDPQQYDTNCSFTFRSELCESTRTKDIMKNY